MLHGRNPGQQEEQASAAQSTPPPSPISGKSSPSLTASTTQP